MLNLPGAIVYGAVGAIGVVLILERTKAVRVVLPGRCRGG